MLLLATLFWVVVGFALVGHAFLKKTPCPRWEDLALMWCVVTVLAWLIGGVRMYGTIFGIV